MMNMIYSKHMRSLKGRRNNGRTNTPPQQFTRRRLSPLPPRSISIIGRLLNRLPPMRPISRINLTRRSRDRLPPMVPRDTMRLWHPLTNRLTRRRPVPPSPSPTSRRSVPPSPSPTSRRSVPPSPSRQSRSSERSTNTKDVDEHSKMIIKHQQALFSDIMPNLRPKRSKKSPSFTKPTKILVVNHRHTTPDTESDTDSDTDSDSDSDSDR